jgi:hypothetical protein
MEEGIKISQRDMHPLNLIQGTTPTSRKCFLRGRLGKCGVRSENRASHDPLAECAGIPGAGWMMSGVGWLAEGVGVRIPDSDSCISDPRPARLKEVPFNKRNTATWSTHHHKHPRGENLRGVCGFGLVAEIILPRDGYR